jgi:hypothetical protein
VKPLWEMTTSTQLATIWHNLSKVNHPLNSLNNISYIILNGRFEPSSHPSSPPVPPPYTCQREQGRTATIIDYAS